MQTIMTIYENVRDRKKLF